MSPRVVTDSIATPIVPHTDLPQLDPFAFSKSEHRQEAYTRDILGRLEGSEAISQRTIARELGIALGLVNLLLRRMANNGLIRLVRVRPNRVLYLITPRGIAEKARMTLAFMARNVQSYRDTRDRILARFHQISREWDPAQGGEDKAVVFCRSGEVAEIGYVCLQDSDLRLVGVVDEPGGRRFFGMTVQAPSMLSGMTIDGEPFGAVVVMSLKDDAIIDVLSARGVDRRRVFKLL